jgi:hypothetical protein
MSLHIGQGPEGQVILPLDAVTRTFAVLGQRGTGKTNAAVDLVEEMVSAGGHVAILDPVGVWYGITHAGTGPGLEGIVIGGEHGDIPLEETGGQLVAEFVVGRHYPVVVIDLKLLRKGAQLRFMADYCEALFHLNRDALHQVFEEADRAAPQQARSQDPVANRLLGAVEDIVKLGRSRGLGATLVTQRPATLNKNVLEVCENLLLFRLMGPNDRKAARAWVEANGDLDALKRVMDSIASLGLGQCWLYSPAWLRLLVQIQTRPRRTFDSSSTPEVGQRAAEPTERAPVDLDALREAMAASIEKVKANDPKALRERVAELEKQLASGSQNAASSEAPKSEPIACDHLDTIVALQAELAVAQAARDAAEEAAADYQVRISVLEHDITYFPLSMQQAAQTLVDAALDAVRKPFAGAPFGGDVDPDDLPGGINARTEAEGPNRPVREGIDAAGREHRDGEARHGDRGSRQGPVGDERGPSDGLAAEPGRRVGTAPAGLRPRSVGKGKGRAGATPGGRSIEEMTEDEAREFIAQEVRRQMAQAGRVLVLPAKEVLRKEYLGIATDRLMQRIGEFDADEREAFRYLLANGRQTINRVAVVISGNDSGGTRKRWSDALAALKSRGVVDANGNGFGVSARDAVVKALAPHEPTDDEVDEVYQLVLGRLVGAGA